MGVAGERFVVAGGSIGGMASALALARLGADVTMVERDVVAEVAGPEEAFALERPGVPQSHFLHAFLARMVQEMQARFPDVLDDLLEAGAQLTRPPVEGLEDVAMLLARRSTVEWVMRRAIGAERGVEVRPGRKVIGVDADGAHVVGARLDDGSRIPGSVVAATGRRPDIGAWLAPAGITVAEELVESALVYITRWYRAPGFTMEANGLLKDLGYMSYLVVPADADTLAVAVGLPPDDRELRACLLDDGGFDRVASMLPGLADGMRDPAVRPLRSSEPMAGLVNRLRHFTDASGRPVVTGFHAVGDAHTCTNPAYGRGCSLAFVMAGLLADAVAAHPADAVARAGAYEASCRDQVEPWFHSAVMMDQARLAMRQGDSGEKGPSTAGQPDVLAVLVAAGAGLVDE